MQLVQKNHLMVAFLFAKSFKQLILITAFNINVLSYLPEKVKADAQIITKKYKNTVD